MNTHYTHITFILDESGSMQSTQQETKKQVYSFIKEQQTLSGECTLSFYTFNSRGFYERGGNIKTHCFFEDIHKWDPQKFMYAPSNSTALWDAVGVGIDETGAYLAKLEENKRPGRVIFVILTDGQENSSTQYSLENIRKKITLQKNTYNWQFMFLGSGEDVWLQGKAMGISGINTYTAYFNNMQEKSRGATYTAASAAVGALRSGGTLAGRVEDFSGTK